MTDDAEVCTKISEKVKMAGFLEKKGSMLWKRYWFVLEDKLLLYYKSQLEYINLSPCRGSLNMSLVSAVQPRRNSKDPIIHLVSRSQSFILKAKDRAGQEKWLQALLDSIGKQGMASLRFSLDDLPGQMKTMTLPKRLHGGSLDAVWKQPVIPKTKMLDKILGYEEEPDENQNTDSYDPAAVERKSHTLDNRKMDSKLEKLRNAIGGRKSSAIFSHDPAATKVRRESFLHKMFKRSPSKIEKELPPCIDSEIDDPFYDTIDHVKSSMEPIKEKPVFVGKILLPEGTIAELKDKLRSKESLEKMNLEDKEPPELPPRSFSNSMTTTEAVVHKSEPCVTDSEESELSGHYQTIKKTEINEEPMSLDMPSIEPEYQVVNKSKKKKYRNLNKDLNEENKEDIPKIDVVLNAGDSKVVSSDISTPKQEKISIFDVEQGLNDLNVLLMRLTEITTAPLAEREELTSWSGAEELLDVKQSLQTVSSQDVRLGLQRSLSQDIKMGFQKSISEAVTDRLRRSSSQEVKVGFHGSNCPDIKVGLQRSTSDPDYDVPRSHQPIQAESAIEQHRIIATEFFNKTDLCTTDSSNSLEPDSLEDKVVLN